MSAMIFSVPTMCENSSGAVFVACCLIANALKRCPALADVDELCFEVHVTADMLSQRDQLFCI